MANVVLSSLFGILTIWVTGFIFTFRNHVTCMTGMMAAMGMGMSVGLTMGTIFAVWLPGQFFQATFISMLIGGAVGVITGKPISLMAVMDGLLSGIMGGMMGTMLMVMMPSPYILPTVKIVSVLCSGIIFILFVMLQSEVRVELLEQKSFILSKPVSMFAVVGLFLAFSFISPFQESNLISAEQSHDHSNNHSGHDHHTNFAHQSELNSSFETELIVRAMEYSFNPSSIHIGLGQKVKITL